MMWVTASVLPDTSELKFLFVVSPQTMGENAPSQLILYHYPELKEDKGVVLMTAEMDPKFIVSLTVFWSSDSWSLVSLLSVSRSSASSNSNFNKCLCSRLQTVHQAQCLANQVQLFYAAARQETFQLVENFNHHPADFKHMSVIAELEQSGMWQAAPPGGP